jgi:hypothetical protein
MIEELDGIILTTDLPEYGLKSGDIGTVVLLHGDKGYEVEFTTLDGDTVAVTSVTVKQVRLAGQREIAHVRMLEYAP